MRVVHEPTGGGPDGPADDTDTDDAAPQTNVLATTVEVADATAAQAKGLRFRRSLPEDYAFVMPVGDDSSIPLLGGPSRNVVDMLFMRVPLDIVWLLDEEVVKVKRMRPWRSFAVAKADTIVELPAGAAVDVAVGDTVRLAEDAD